jgi:alpha-1,6-mannosyltransferase
MVIFKPDGAHGMYSWPHVLLATAVALFAWRTLNRPAVEEQPA